MASNSKIEWTEATWNPVSGCTKVSEGCRNCYAMTTARRLAAMAEADLEAGRNPGRKAHYLNVVRYDKPEPGDDREPRPLPQWNNNVVCVEEALADPLHWRKPRTVFVNSMSDLFHPAVPFDFVDRVFAVMALTPQHTYQILTKRPERMAEYLSRHSMRGRIYDTSVWQDPGDGRDRVPVDWPLPNVWLGTSVENQAVADERREPLRILAERGWITWVSNEPAIGPVDWAGWEFLRWLVSGGESGPSARPSHPDWHRAARDFCTDNGIAYHFKQWGEHRPATTVEEAGGSNPILVGRDGGEVFSGCHHMRHQVESYLDPSEFRPCAMARVGKKKAGRLLDGRTWDEFPVAQEVK